MRLAGGDQVESDGKSKSRGSCWISPAKRSRMFLKESSGCCCRFFKVWSKLVRISRVLAPFSDCEPKLTFRAITVGRSSRSAAIVVGGHAAVFGPVIEAVRVFPEDILDVADS